MLRYPAGGFSNSETFRYAAKIGVIETAKKFHSMNNRRVENQDEFLVHDNCKAFRVNKVIVDDNKTIKKICEEKTHTLPAANVTAAGRVMQAWRGFYNSCFNEAVSQNNPLLRSTLKQPHQSKFYACVVNKINFFAHKLLINS